MRGKNIQFIINAFLIIFIMSSSSYAEPGDKDEWNLFYLIKKCFGCLKEQIFDDEDEELLDEPYNTSLSTDDENEELLGGPYNTSLIEQLPREIIWEVFMNLSPRDIKHASYSCKNLKKSTKKRFWNAYLHDYKRKIWNETTPLDRVAFAYLLYEEGEVEASSALGLPQAIAIIRGKNEKEERKQSEKQDKKMEYDFYKYESHPYFQNPGGFFYPGLLQEKLKFSHHHGF